MRVLLDECLPRRLANVIIGHEVTSVQQAGFAGMKNGVLLKQIDMRFDAFVTVDKNLPAQNQTVQRSFGIIVLRAPSNRLDALRPLAPRILAELETLKAGQIVFVGAEAR